ncbi:Inositol-pentakisphosphate 2-kinase [Cladophialophora chaetospira]|uniref:Inositol-pentakisphosphate 2-kinase n=1 Tax=Cladophialophora chaetospira TaxID=386627 RepID=A0AA39CNP9_9EURO|nr:Inositol-pentakisphosphate 2-kinase [Cladophialophora chaetospira]
MSTRAATHRSSASCPNAIKDATLQLLYLAEGAANIIYSVSVISPKSLQDHSHCCIMRLRKDLAFTKPARQVMTDFEEKIIPLFGDEYRALLMEQVLYKLKSEIVQDSNKELRGMDEVDLSSLSAEDVIALGKRVRHQQRRHVYLPSYETEQYGILMQNLQGPGIDWLFEFKPKWLVQSPSAPKDARNCRTCALNASRRKDGKHKGRGDSGFCPFDLLVRDGENNVLRRALENIWPLENGIEEFVRAFRDKVQPALRHLQQLEKEHGAVGLDDFRSPDGKDFGVAMALRDCSVFLALKRRESDKGVVDVVDVKFADLDLKTTEGGKVQKWAAMEQELLDGGWLELLAESCK